MLALATFAIPAIAPSVAADTPGTSPTPGMLAARAAWWGLDFSSVSADAGICALPGPSTLFHAAA